MASGPAHVRPADAADAAGIAAIYRRFVTGTAVSFEEQPPGEAEIRRRMTAQPRMPWLVAAHGSSVLGYAYASRHRQRPAYRWSADSSVYVAEEHQGHGIGRLLCERLIEEARESGYVSLLAGIALPNPASVALHEACGYERVGVFRHVGFKHGEWRDVGWWQRLLVDPPPDPDEPRPFATA